MLHMEETLFFIVCGDIFLFAIGMFLAYFIVMADVLAPIIQNIFESDDFDTDYRFYAIILVSFSLAFFWIKKENYESKIVPVITTSCILIFWLAQWVYYVDSLTQQERNISEYVYPNESLYSYFKVIPLIFLAFWFQSNFLSSNISFSLEKRENVWKIVIISYVLSTIVYLLFVIFTMALFGDNMKFNLLMTLLTDERSSLKYICILLFIVISSTQAPLIFNLGKESILAIYCEAKYNTFTQNKVVETDDNESELQFSISRHSLKRVEIAKMLESKEYYMLISLVYIFAIIFSLCISDLQFIFTVIGILSASPICFVFPAVFYLKLNEGKLSLIQKLPALLLMIYGIINI